MTATLGERMKGYEQAIGSVLQRRTPVIIRVDGKAFHTFTKQFSLIDPSLSKSPFSEVMHQCMVAASVGLMHCVQNAVIAYTQSDEISVLLKDWDSHETEQWFGAKVQKMASVSASIATHAFTMRLLDFINRDELRGSYTPLFDARVFNLPKEEVNNYFIWRQQDATRNSISMLGRFYFSQKQMHGKNKNEVQDMLMEHHGINWNDIPTWNKRGTCILRRPLFSSGNFPIDEEIPIFTQDRNYINGLLEVSSDESIDN